jgi:hypothetical protein
MWDFELLSATRAVERTMPFVFYRLLMYLAISLAYLIAALAGAGTAVAIGSLSRNPFALANLGALMGFAFCGWLLWKARKALLFRITGRHLGLLAELTRGTSLPDGKAQLARAKQIGDAYFRTPALIFELRQRVRDILFAIAENRAANAFAAITQPVLAKGSARLAGLIGTYWDEAVLGTSLVSEAQDPWRSVHAALLAFPRRVDRLLKNGIYLIVFEYAGLLAIFLLLLAPIRALAADLPLPPGLWPYVFALLLAWSIKSAFLRPIALAAMIQVYTRSEDGSTPAPGAETLPRNISDKMEALREKAGS